jgi:hypothetical protein
MRTWLGVVSLEHVRRGVHLGIAQIGHGKRAGLARMAEGDTLIYYSPTEHLGDKVKLSQFTAFGTVCDSEIWQADEGDFRPFRRKVRYESVRTLPLNEASSQLDLTAQPSWGYQLRLGLINLTSHDREVLWKLMVESHKAQ